MDSYGVLSSCAHINRDKSDPHRKEYQHAEGNELGLIKIVREFASQKSRQEAHAGQDANVSENTPEANI